MKYLLLLAALLSGSVQASAQEQHQFCQKQSYILFEIWTRAERGNTPQQVLEHIILNRGYTIEEVRVPFVAVQELSKAKLTKAEAAVWLYESCMKVLKRDNVKSL